MSDTVSYHPKDWERVQKLGLHRSVVSPDSYAARVAHGMQLAQATLEATREPVPTIPTMKGLHYIMFEAVHPWAGTFRQPGQEVRAGELICSLAEDVVGDLLRLRREMVNNPLTGSKQYKAEVVAFYHASLLAIHPFLDGNGRVARTILDFQTRKMLGHPLSQSIGREEYVGALGHAQNQGDLKPLARIVSRDELAIRQSLDHAVQKRLGRHASDDLVISKPVFLRDDVKERCPRR